MTVRFLEDSGKIFGILMIFFVLAVFSVSALAIGYDKGWSGPIDSFGMSLDVVFVTIFMLFMIVGLFTVIMRRT